MTIMQQVVQTTVDYLENEQTLANETIVAAYDDDIHPIPTDKCIVSVGMTSIGFSEKLKVVSDDGYESVTNNRRYTAKMKIKIFVPYESGSTAGFAVADKIYTSLFYGRYPYEVTKAEIKDADYDRTTEALVIDSTFTVSATISS